MTPVEEVMRALDDMVRAGKVLYVGISDTPDWIVSQANTHSPRSMAGARSLDCKLNTVSRSANRNATCFRWRARLILA
jgi:aryl-alcohol dehydrogenase-like predicted oxidoreductase